MEDAIDRGAYVAQVSKQLIDDSISKREEVVTALMGKGAIVWVASNIGSDSENALIVAQYEQVVRGNSSEAREWLAKPSNMKPGFSVCAGYMREAIRGERLWNGAKLSLVSALGPVMCMLLLGKLDTIEHEYEAVLQGEDLFAPTDPTSLRAVLTRHLILASQGRSQEVYEADYIRCRDLNKGPVFKDYHLLMLTLGHGDALAFNAELNKRCLQFKKRKSSRLIAAAWGFGEAAQWAFDVLGTAICRLAHHQGLAVEVPDSKLYPPEFWRE